MKKILFSMALIALVAVAGFSQADLQPAATVNLIRTETITVRQLRTEVERMEKATGRTLTPNERLQVLDHIINERLALQAAERDRITVTENEVNQQLDQLYTAFTQQAAQQRREPPTPADFAQVVRNETGYNLLVTINQSTRRNDYSGEYKEQLRRQMITQKYLLSKKENLINSITSPTEAEILATYNLARAQFVRPDTVRYSMIQIPYGPDAASRTRARDLANRLFQEIGSNPSRFDEVVARSHNPNSGFQAGDAGFLPRNHEAQSVVGADFMNTAFGLRQGEVSKLIEGNPGFQIIKITESYSMKNLELDDIFQLGTRVTVRDFIRQGLMSEKQQAILVQATQELVTELRAGRTFQIFERNINW